MAVCQHTLTKQSVLFAAKGCVVKLTIDFEDLLKKDTKAVACHSVATPMQPQHFQQYRK